MFDTTRGPAREQLEPNVVKKLEVAGTLVHDDRRLRSFFFDGRFLTAKDLTREQTYFLTRQADLGRGGGIGVVAGLHVENGPDPRALRITAGHGVTPSGEVVVIPRELANVRLDDIPEIQRLDAAFGLAQLPRETARNRSGLYIVALRPVEYTANPVASYPSSAGGTRTAQDGDIIEATALTLIPYPDSHAGAGFESRRARVAHETFVRKGGMRPPVDALPIAMIALDHGVIRWIDKYLVRREVGSEQTDFLGFGQAPRALREAHLQQYQRHLKEVVADRKQANRGERFAASEHFFALPPAGPLPVAAVDPQSLTEVFFPPEVDVELSVIPEDELGALLEESLFLSPIDLTRTGEELSSTSVLVLVPVPRQAMDEALSTLFPAERASTVQLRATASGLVARRQPGEALKALTLRRTTLATPTAAGPSLANAAWSNLLSGASTLWYARRRNFPYKPAAVGQIVEEPDDLEDSFTALLWEAEFYDEFGSLPKRATALAIAKAYTLMRSFSEGDYAAGKQLSAGVGGELLRQKWLHSGTVQSVQQRYTYTNRGVGLSNLMSALNEKYEYEIPLPHFSRASSVVELDKYAYLASTDGKSELLRDTVYTHLTGGKTLDDAVIAFRKNYTPPPTSPGQEGRQPMNTKPLKESLPDEHILQVEPRPKPTVDAGWLRRPNLYTGRALSAESLATEQHERSGRLALRGQFVAPGVVAGLEVRLETEFNEHEKRFVHLFQIGPGLGLTASGEDVMVPRTTRVRVDRVPAFWLEEGQEPSSFDLSILYASEVAPTHKGLLAAVLMLVPVVSRKNDPSDPNDPDAYAFEDQRWVDGCAPVLFAWPKHWHIPDPEALDWRNRLAWKLFEDERLRSPEECALWETVGVPLALIGFTPPADINSLAVPLFADRASVVRSGGAPRHRPSLLDAHGNPLLWQARTQQFSEHLASIPPQQLATAVRFFAKLPPVGVLPKHVVDLFDWTNRFFPAPFILDAAPVPLEQLDAVALASASLAPLDTSAQERVRVLVPIPEAHFDPYLLRGEAIDPAFSEAITSGLARLGEWLRRRKNLRGKAVLLLNVLEGKKPNRFPELDPSAIPGESPGTVPLDPTQYGPEEVAYGTQGNTVPSLEEVLLRWGQRGTWDEPALLGIETEEVSTADSTVGSFGLVTRQGGTHLMHTGYRDTWQPWKSIPDILPGTTQSLEGFKTIWCGDDLALVALISEPIATPAPVDGALSTSPGRTFFLRIYHHLDESGWQWEKLEHVQASRVTHFAPVAWGPGRIDTFMAVETDTVSDTGSSTSYQLLKLTWMYGAAAQPAKVALAEAADRQVSAMTALQRKDERIELLFLARKHSDETSADDKPWLHHVSGFHEEDAADLSQLEMVETTDATGSLLSVCLTGPNQLDALVMGETGIVHGQYATDWKFEAEQVSTTSGDVLVAVSRLDGQVHAFWWKRESDQASPLMYGWFDGNRWTEPRVLMQVQLHTSRQPLSVILDGTSQLDVFLASLQGLQHLKMLPDSTRALVEKQGLRGLLSQTEGLLGRVDEFIRAGSAQVQADTQNVRQLMISGHTEASRLVVSPILGATMVPSPLAARSDIESYFTRFLRKSDEPQIEDPTSKEDARETLEQATSTRRELIARLVNLVRDLRLDVTGITVAGIAQVYYSPNMRAKLRRVNDSLTKIVERESILLTSLVDNPSTLEDVLTRIGNEPDAIERALHAASLSWEKSDYFSTSVQHLEDMLVLLRELERRTLPHESALASYKGVLAQLERFWSELDKRLRLVDGEVAEGRQDVTVARALLAEETVRIGAINERRKQVFAEHVPFLVFQRPRQRELTRDTPTRLLDPGLVKEILPEVLASTAAAPPELLAYVELIRDSSLKWFSLAPQLLHGLDRTELIHRTFEWAQVRAIQRVPVKLPVIAGRSSVRFAQGLSRLVAAREELIARQRGAFIHFEPAVLHARTWLELQQSAHEQLSLGDLIDMAHGRSDVGRRATTELEQISKVATGLYERIGEVLPTIRLEWAEQLSQYDAPVDLHDLSRLPQWHRLEVTARREMQTLVDWLFQRVVRTEPDALSLMNDLVRVCLLLASHAPVNELLSGHVFKPSVAKVGGTLELAVDPARVRIGMHVLIRSGEQTVQAVVEDLSLSVVRARVLSATAPSVSLPVKTSAYFSDPARGMGALLPYVGLKR